VKSGIGKDQKKLGKKGCVEEEEEVILTSTRLTIAYGTDRLTQ
jgi:hypothetical protein